MQAGISLDTFCLELISRFQLPIGVMIDTLSNSSKFHQILVRVSVTNAGIFQSAKVHSKMAISLLLLKFFH